MKNYLLKLTLSIFLIFSSSTLFTEPVFSGCEELRDSFPLCHPAQGQGLNDNPICTDYMDDHNCDHHCLHSFCISGPPVQGYFGRCVYIFQENLPCEDGDYCNVNETCQDGNCQGGNERDCDDNNWCTTDVCDERTNQCLNQPNSYECFDGLWCNGRDYCSGGECRIHEGSICEPGQICREIGQGTCVDCVLNQDCDDRIFCNGKENCQDGECVTGDNPCQANQICIEDMDLCADRPRCRLPGDCNDHNRCTNDSCDNGYCYYKNNDNESCTDGLFCNGSDMCKDGTCSVHRGNSCEFGCDENENACTCQNDSHCDDGVNCTANTCAQGLCESIADDALCNDNNVCTTDTCSLSTGCVYTNNSESCNDELFCNGTELCVNGVCESSGNPCSGDTPLCNEGTDSCDPKPIKACEEDEDCDDDDVFCNGDEICIDKICESEGNPCPEGTECIEETEECRERPLPDTTTTTTTTAETSTTTTTKCRCLSKKIYGEDSEETELLRYFRDNLLNQTPEGQEIIRLYYQWSPVILKAMEEDEEFKEDVKEMIDGVLGLIEDKTEQIFRFEKHFKRQGFGSAFCLMCPKTYCGANRPTEL